MALFELNYGDLLRPEFRIVPHSGWGQCTNFTTEQLIVYGPKHPKERSIFDTSPYTLPPGATTPDHWDCDGFLVPADRALRRRRRTLRGPLAIKFWDYRRFWVKLDESDTYVCPWDNGIFKPSQINWAIPNLSYPDVCLRAGRLKPK